MKKKADEEEKGERAEEGEAEQEEEAKQGDGNEVGVRVEPSKRQKTDKVDASKQHWLKR